MTRAIALAPLALALFAGCGDKDDDVPLDEGSGDDGAGHDSGDMDVGDIHCSEAGDATLTAAVSPESNTTVNLVVESPEPVEAQVVVRVPGEDGDLVFARPFEAVDARAESLFWGLPPDTDVGLSLVAVPESDPSTTWCPPEVVVRTGRAEAGAFGGWQVVQDAGEPIPPLRMLVIARIQGGINMIMLLDEEGQQLWSAALEDLPRVDKSVLRDTDGQGVLMVEETRDVAEASTLWQIPVVGPITKRTLPGALHHGFALLPDGELLASGWDLRPYGSVNLLGDTLVRFYPGDETWTEVWNAFDDLDLPSEGEVETWPSPGGIYEASEVVTWTYLNYVGYDAASGWAGAVLAGKDRGVVALDTATNESWSLLIDDPALTVDGVRPGLEVPFERGHSVVFGGPDRVLFYDRHNPDETSTVDAWTLDDSRHQLSTVATYEVVDADGIGIKNPLSGNAGPVDSHLGGGLIVAYHPTGGLVVDVLTDPFAPEGAPSGVMSTLRKLAPVPGSVEPFDSAFMAAYSLPGLNAASEVPLPSER